MMRSTRWTLVLGASLVAITAAAAPAHAAVYTVTRTDDAADGACNTDCSLREAILAANANAGPDVILLPAGIYTLSLAGAGEDQGAQGDLDIRDDLTIIGASADSTAIDGGQLDRVIDVQAGVHAQISGVTIRNGRVAGPGGGVRNAGTLELSASVVSGNATTQGGYGGGLASSGDGTLTLTQTTLTGNTADGGGGGLALSSTSEIRESTVSGNRANLNGGGLYAYARTHAVLAGTTISGNTSVKNGGGIYSELAPFTSVTQPELRDSILAGNTGTPQRDCTGAVQSDGYNLVGDGTDCIDFRPNHHDFAGVGGVILDPKLGPLAANGGPTPTHALLAGSPALGQSSSCNAADQRGQARPATGCDIGAFQTGTACVAGGSNLCLSNGRFRVSVQWRNHQTSGGGHAVSLSGDSGYFWFFGPTNVELIVKVLNGCGLNHRYWVFQGGLTNVEATITVTDTKTGTTKTYFNKLDNIFATNLDANAFNTCP